MDEIFKKFKVNECCVCFEHCETKTRCNHYICYKCREHIILNNNSICPICRGKDINEVNDNDI